MEHNPIELSAEQARVANAKVSGLCVIAGPGSGKTFTLVERYAVLLERYAADEIRVITFTRNAARHLVEKIEARGLPLPGYCGTLHGFARRFAPGAMLETEESDTALVDTARRVNCKDGPDKLRRVLTQLEPGTDVQKIVVRRFRQWMRQERLCDTDTILLDLLDHLNASSAIPSGALLVDEAQDSGTIDWAIFDAIRAESKTFVGDVDQSMYGFRGGRPELLLAYGDRPGVSTVYMNANYRSVKAIVSAANNLAGRELQSVRPQAPGHVTVAEFDSEFTEGDSVVSLVKAIRDRLPDATVAVLCRYNAAVRKYSTRLRGAGLMPPAQESAEPADWKLATATLRLQLDPDNAILKALWEKKTSKAWTGKHPLTENALKAAGVTRRTVERINSMSREATGEELLNAMREKFIEPEPIRDAVCCMTFHGSKGLEFDYVIIPEMDIDIGSKPPAAEEKRCFFVALTRARFNVHCLCARHRVNEFTGQNDVRVPSPFLKMLSKDDK